MKLKLLLVAAILSTIFACSSQEGSLENVARTSQAFSTGEGQLFAQGGISDLCLEASQGYAPNADVFSQLCDSTKETQKWSIGSCASANPAWDKTQYLWHINNGNVYVLNEITGFGGRVYMTYTAGTTFRPCYNGGTTFPSAAMDLSHNLIRSSDNRCMDGGTTPGTVVTFDTCKHTSGQVWLGAGGYVVAITTSTLDGAGRPLYVNDGTPITQQPCTTGSTTNSRCAPNLQQQFSLTFQPAGPGQTSAGMLIRDTNVNTSYWYTDPLHDPVTMGPGAITHTATGYQFTANKFSFAQDTGNPGKSIVGIATPNQGQVMSVSQNAGVDGATVQMDYPLQTPATDWYYVYRSQ
jgi:hypothetical protein